MGIGCSPCGCTPEKEHPGCRNWRSTYVIDWADKKPVTLRECPNRFDDGELWEVIYAALYRLKDLERSLSFYGIPEQHLAEPVHSLLEEVYAARDRYRTQKEERES